MGIQKRMESKSLLPKPHGNSATNGTRSYERNKGHRYERSHRTRTERGTRQLVPLNDAAQAESGDDRLRGGRRRCCRRRSEDQSVKELFWFGWKITT